MVSGSLAGVDEPWHIPKGLRRFHLHELEKATKNFSQQHYLGMGGFGKVYKGVLTDGKAVAIKCASLQSAQGQKEFQNELMLLGRLHHCNLVGLQGFCDDGGLQVKLSLHTCSQFPLYLHFVIPNLTNQLELCRFSCTSTWKMVTFTTTCSVSVGNPTT